MKINVYVLVFGIVGVLIVAAALSTFVFNMSTSSGSLQNLGPAPDVQGTSGWINSEPLHIPQLAGKVVLIDFWTYSCINCIRTIPFLNALQNKYGSNGLVIIGVHTPEFQFEKNHSNVLAAVQKFGIKYAVVLDSNSSTWNAYNNRYWPAHYIIDKSGIIRYEQFGEGNDNQTESVIRTLLKEANYSISQNLTNVTSSTDFSQIRSPEIYLGYREARVPLGNTQGFSPGQTVNYTFSNITQVNSVYLLGPWYNSQDSMVAASNESKLFLVYSAKDVNIVAGGNSSVAVSLDGSDLQQAYLGADARLQNNTAIVSINSSRLYNIVSAPIYGPHALEIDATQNFRIYTFTFG